MKEQLFLLGGIILCILIGITHAENIALQSYGGTSLFTKYGPHVDSDWSQWNLFDGDTSTVATYSPVAGKTSFARHWWKNVTINSITLYKSKYSEGEWESNIIIKHHTNSGWVEDYNGASIYSGTITVNFASPVTADAVEVIGTAGTNRYVKFKELVVDGSASGAAISPVNIGDISYGGTWDCSRGTSAAEKFFDSDENTSSHAVLYKGTPGWVERHWDTPMRIDEIATAVDGYYGNYSGNIAKIQYWDDNTGSWVDIPDTNISGAHSNNPNYGVSQKWFKGIHLETPIYTSGIRIDGITGTYNQFVDINEIWIYQVPEPTTVGLITLGTFGLLRKK